MDLNLRSQHSSSCYANLQNNDNGNMLLAVNGNQFELLSLASLLSKISTEHKVQPRRSCWRL